MRAARLFVGLILFSSASLSAQASVSAKSDVRAFVRAYAEAANHGDVAAYTEMYKESVDLIAISDGVMSRGWSSMRDEANQMLGKEGLYKISTGVVDVLALGTTRAVAMFPFVLTLQTERGPATLNGAMTLVLEKSGAKWLIIHDHTSLQALQEEQAK